MLILIFYYHKYLGMESSKGILRRVQYFIEVLVSGLQVKTQLSSLVFIEVVTGLETDKINVSLMCLMFLLL